MKPTNQWTTTKKESKVRKKKMTKRENNKQVAYCYGRAEDAAALQEAIKWARGRVKASNHHWLLLTNNEHKIGCYHLECQIFDCVKMERTRSFNGNHATIYLRFPLFFLHWFQCFLFDCFFNIRVLGWRKWDAGWTNRELLQTNKTKTETSNNRKKIM